MFISFKVDSKTKFFVSEFNQSDIDADVNPFGVIQSGGYPEYTTSVFYTRRLITRSNKVFRVTFTDLNIGERDATSGE